MHAPQTGTVLCHGCWDNLHIGHIRHLQEAKALGNRLIVSVTSDRHVNKGVGRPRFSQELRMEALRALDCVDQVVLNDAPHPTELIDQIKPSIYVKGSDYEAGALIESEAVQRNGGRVHITGTAKWSSSRLINQDKFNDETVEYLEKARAAGFLDRILGAFEAADQTEIAFVGETIIDQYRHVQALGKTSKEFTLATVEVGFEEFEGGVMAASRHGEWRKVSVITGAMPITKTRYVDSDFSRKLFEIYSDRTIAQSDKQRAYFHDDLGEAIGAGRTIIAFDFGHGLIRQSNRQMMQHAKFLAVNAQSNAGNFGFNPVTQYPKANLICIDDPEARLATGMQHEPIDIVARTLSMKMPGSDLIVTHGRRGCIAMERKTGHLARIPAFALQAVDTMGAGDAFLAVAGPLAATGLPTEMAAFAGNVAGSIKVSIVGHRRHVGRSELVSTIESLLK